MKTQRNGQLRSAAAVFLVFLTGCTPPPSNNNTNGAAKAAPATPAAATPAAAAPAAAAPAAAAPAAAAPAAAAPAAVGQEAVVTLGGPELTSGIPGEGPLTTAQIQAWLDDPTNHQVLQIVLPLGINQMPAQGLESNPLTRAKVELGRQLYFDTRLSSDSSISCASCHHPDQGYARQTQFGVGVGGQTGGRNSPVSYNRIVSGPQFWDGRASSLEDQAKGPIANPIEMGNTHEQAVKTVESLEGYRMQFAKVFPDQGVTIDTIALAIAAFERTLVSGPTPYDYYEPYRALSERVADLVAEPELFKEEEPDLYEQYVALKSAADSHPMSDSAKRGRDLFFGKANCTACHAGANFTDEKYHNIGVGMEAEKPDLGRYEVTKDDKDRGAFKTPTCRNVMFSAPYMHDGSQKTLEEVVKWYNQGGHPNQYLSDKIKKLNLSDQEMQDLVAFMKEGLTGPFTPVVTDRLPQD